MIEAKADYFFDFWTNKNGDEMDHAFDLTLKKPIDKEIAEFIMRLDGIDLVTEPKGRYTIGIIIAKTFDVDEVIEALKEGLKSLQSNIITPKLEIVQ